MKNLIYNNTILLFLNIDDFFNLKKGELKEIRNKYLEKYDHCIIYNYFDLKNHKNLIKDRINKLCFVNQKIIHARKCDIKIVSSELKNEFLNKYHIQGTDKSQIIYGAYYNDELVSIMTFNNINKLTKNIDNNSFDLSRFSIKTGLIINGIFNKILNKFIKDYKPSKIISYADLSYVNKNSNIYVNNGFKLVKNIQPDFKFYHKSKNNIYHKFTFGTKYKKTHNDYNLIKNELIKLWNVGKLKYELYLDENQKVIYGFIYMIKNKLNNKIYIGQTTRNLNKRYYEYKSAYNKQTFYNQYLLNSYNKYGFDNFEFSIIDTASTMDELNAKEKNYILKYKSYDRNIGYNIELGGNNAIPSEETLNKMSYSHKGIKQTETWIKKRIAPAGSDDAKKYGKVKTEEEKKYLSEHSPKYWLGKKRDEETRKKISETKKKRGVSKKQIKAYFKTVYKIDINTNKIVEKYISTNDAATQEGVNQSTISRWCKIDKIVNGYKWSYNNN